MLRWFAYVFWCRNIVSDHPWFGKLSPPALSNLISEVPELEGPTSLMGLTFSQR
jgi:hypothetical protein